MPGTGPSRAAAALAAAGLLALGLAATATAGPLVIAEAERERLDQGEVLVASLRPVGEGGFAVRAVAVVDAPPSAVWPVVRDCGDFDRFMPRTRESALLEKGDASSVCSVTVDLPFPFGELFSVVRSDLREVPGGGYERSWSLLRGDFERSDGAWTVTPWGDEPGRSLVAYHQEAKPKASLPSQFFRMAQKRTLPQVVEAIRLRVRELGRDVAARP